MNQKRNTDYEYDLAVIGAGPGGYVAAIAGARDGLKTILIEKEKLGGTCLNRGCIPTKAMLHSGEVLAAVRRAGEFGIVVEGRVGVDLEAVHAYRDKTVSRLRAGVKGLLKYHGVEVLTAEGVLTGAYTIRCTAPGGSARTLHAGAIIAACGSRPSVPPIPGLAAIDFWTSDTLLEESRSLPRSMTIIGGGVIGAECATILHDFGVEVTIVELMPQLLPRMDADIARLLEKELRARGIGIFTGTTVTRAARDADGLKTCSLRSGERELTVTAEELLVAVGRQPASDLVGLEAVGAAVERGFVTTDENCRTSVPGLYAVGDLVGGWMLAHDASAQALKAVDHILGRPNYIRRSVVPACVYTRPEIASVGLTASEAAERGHNVSEGVFPMKACSKAVIIGETEGFVKVVADTGTGEILGAHLISPRATDIIAELALAVSSELTVEELFSTIHPHPTISEAVMEAAHAVEGRAVHLADGRS